MRALRGSITIAATLLVGSAAILIACDQEKMGAEKRAEEMAKSASAAKSAAQNQPPDPAELKYKERKTSLEKTVQEKWADEALIMAKDPKATPGILRHYFESGPIGDKLSADLTAKRKKDGDDGYRIKQAKVVETRVQGNMEDAEIEVQEETTAKGNAGCLLYVQNWKYVSDAWIFKAQKSVKKVDCT